MLPQILNTACRYIPLIPQMAISNFNVNIVGENLTSFEKVAICGDHRNLGSWNIQKAVLLDPSSEQHMWEADVQIEIDTTVRYRYFIVTESGDSVGMGIRRFRRMSGGISTGMNNALKSAMSSAAIDDARENDEDEKENPRTIQVRRWESHLEARSMTVTKDYEKFMDNFGYIDSYEREVKNGWLDTGSILQFKVYGNALETKPAPPRNVQLRIKVEPVDATTLSPIMPSAQAYVECTSISHSNCFLCDQTEYGVSYKAPEMLIFHTELTNVQNTSYLLKLYGVQANNASANLICYQYIFAHDIVGSEGTLTLVLLSPIWLNSIGKLKLHYLVITPMPSSQSSPKDLHFSLGNYWNDEWKDLDGAHRGMGISFQAQINHPDYNENTVASFKAAAKLPIDMIECDVMLTSDMVPIVFHDFEIHISTHNNPKRKEDLNTIMVKDFTYDELKNMYFYILSGKKIIDFSPQKDLEDSDERLFPRLSKVLQKVTKSVAFVVEVKWPQLQEDGKMESVQSIDKNDYVDRILEVVKIYGGGRLIFLASFDADICTMMRYKQNMYQVMFITPNRTERYNDPRSHNFEYQINFTQAFGLLGIIAHTYYIANDPRLIKYAEKRKKKVFLWGEDLQDSATIAYFKQQGVVACIYDRVDLWLSVDKKRVLEMENNTEDTAT